MIDQTELASRAQTVGAAAEDAMRWVADPENAEMVGSESKDLTKSLRRHARRARKLSKAARTKMAVSVFGPSQAGKSFLVSVLARPKGGRLVADFGGLEGQLDYISQVNPEGEGESTGLVTRFTMTRSPAPEGFPVSLRLFSEADILRTLANSFFMDGDEDAEEPPRPEDLDALISSLTSKAGDGASGIDEDDVWDTRDYVEKNFGSRTYAEALKGYWAEAAVLAPKLQVAERGQLFSLLWGRHESLTKLFVDLATARQKLGEDELVHAGLDALVPRERSIIDVKTLKGLTGESGALAVRTANGSDQTVSRATLCALTAELILPMRDQPWPLFEHTDLLDFPGARNRFKDPLALTLREPQNLFELLLRGKVAYLFDRYVEAQEITSMLLCIPDSNMEAVDLPRLVENWIALTHGTNAADRAKAECILFFVLTKFDKHLGESAADGGPESRFQRRMEASLEKFSRHSDSWLREWTPGKPFKNCFWVRNPNYYVTGLIEYDDQKRELCIQQSQEARLEELRIGCLAAEAVRKHFADPAASWDAALSLNDGGSNHIVAALAKVCRIDVKLRQIEGQLDIEARQITARVSPFHVASDAETRLEEKRVAADRVIDALEFAALRNSFGALHSALTVRDDIIADRIARVPGNIAISAAGDNGTSRNVPGVGARRVGATRVRPGRSATAASPSAEAVVIAKEDEVRVITREAFQAETALETWLDAMQRFSDGKQIESRFGMTSETAQCLVAEISHSARRCGLRSRIVERLKEATANFSLSTQQQSGPASLICAEAINRFVEDFDARNLPEDKRPNVELSDGSRQPVFLEQELQFDTAAFPEEPISYADRRWTDWTHALLAMFEANALDMDGTSVNLEQNIKLGKILKILNTSLRPT